MEKNLNRWHKEACRVTFKLVSMLARRRGSRAGLGECAAILEHLAGDIRRNLAGKGPQGHLRA